MEEEILDLVDASDFVIGRIKRSEYFVGKDPTLFCRAVNAFIENDKGQLWIPRRTAHKKMFPLFLDMSVSGCVSSGETYEQAFIREASEEINIDMQTVPYECVGYFTPPQHGVRFFMKVYKIKMNTAPAYNPDDFCHAFWLTPAELLEKIAAGDQCKFDLPRLITLLYNCPKQ